MYHYQLIFLTYSIFFISGLQIFRYFDTVSLFFEWISLCTAAYAHCSALLVNMNTQVSAGTIIAKVGSKGWATGPHLHFEIRINGESINPRRYLQGLAPSSGTCYGTLPDSIKNTFDVAYDFGKPLREVIEKVGEQCQDALKNLVGVGKWLLIVLT